MKLWAKHDSTCVSCAGLGVRAKRSERFAYRYFVIVNEAHQAFDMSSSSGGRRGHGLKYEVARHADGDQGEELAFGDSEVEVLTTCGRFSSDFKQGRTFASDREADRTVERLASGMPIFITRAAALAATIGVVVPAWLAVLL